MQSACTCYKCTHRFHTAYIYLTEFSCNNFADFLDVQVEKIKILSSWWCCFVAATSPIGTTHLTLELFLFSYIKGTLDKYNIYLLILNSIEDYKLNQYQNFQLFLPMRFHFMRYFVNCIIFRVSHRLLYCVFIEVDFEK